VHPRTCLAYRSCLHLPGWLRDLCAIDIRIACSPGHRPRRHRYELGEVAEGSRLQHDDVTGCFYPLQKVTFTSEMDLTDPAMPLSHTVLQRSGNVVDVYSQGGFLFTFQNGKWQKVKSSSTSSLTPADLVTLTEGAEKPRVSTTSASYRVTFDVNPKTLQKLDLLGTGAASGTSAQGGAVPGLHMSAVYTIARDTQLVQAASLDMSMPDVTGDGNTTGTLARSSTTSTSRST